RFRHEVAVQVIAIAPGPRASGDGRAVPGEVVGDGGDVPVRVEDARNSVQPVVLVARNGRPARPADLLHLDQPSQGVVARAALAPRRVGSDVADRLHQTGVLDGGPGPVGPDETKYPT